VLATMGAPMVASTNLQAPLCCLGAPASRRLLIVTNSSDDVFRLLSP